MQWLVQESCNVNVMISFLMQVFFLGTEASNPNSGTILFLVITVTVLLLNNDTDPGAGTAMACNPSTQAQLPT